MNRVEARDGVNSPIIAVETCECPPLHHNYSGGCRSDRSEVIKARLTVWHKLCGLFPEKYRGKGRVAGGRFTGSKLAQRWYVLYPVKLEPPIAHVRANAKDILRADQRLRCQQR